MWLVEANVVARFINEACDRIDLSEAKCTTSFAYSTFKGWCYANGVQHRHMPQLNNFGTRFKDLGYLVKHTNAGTKIYGISIKEEWAKKAVAT
jgi:hypothetical protein